MVSVLILLTKLHAVSPRKGRLTSIVARSFVGGTSNSWRMMSQRKWSGIHREKIVWIAWRRDCPLDGDMTRYKQKRRRKLWSQKSCLGSDFVPLAKWLFRLFIFLRYVWVGLPGLERNCEKSYKPMKLLQWWRRHWIPSNAFFVRALMAWNGIWIVAKFQVTMLFF